MNTIKDKIKIVGARVVENFKYFMPTIMKEMLITLKELAVSAVITTVVVVIICTTLVLNTGIPTASMEDTIPTNSVMFCSRVSYWFTTPKRGDIVVFKRNVPKSNENSDIFFTKRVIGVSGDSVNIVDGVTYINGDIIAEPYLKEKPVVADLGPYIVPDGQYFMMGDNRNDSNDSRYWEECFVPEENIAAKGLYLIYPLDNIKSVYAIG